MCAHRIGIVGCADADARTLQLDLVRKGYLADVMEASADVLAYTHAVRPLVLVLGIGSTGKSSLSLIATLRKIGPPPLIVVVGPEADAASQIESLAHGASDFIPEPLHAPELLARLNILLGHATPHGTETTPLDKIRQVLTGTESEVFFVLHGAMPRTMSREEIMWEARRQRISPEDRTLDVYVSHIRKKLKLIRAEFAIETVRGKGFRLVDTMYSAEPLRVTGTTDGRHGA